MFVCDPPWQWYLAGTVCHCRARETIPPASSTPNPNKWLNSNPTPFIVHWNLRLASNNEFLFEVNTVKCCISLHVKSGLLNVYTYKYNLHWDNNIYNNLVVRQYNWTCPLKRNQRPKNYKIIFYGKRIVEFKPYKTQCLIVKMEVWIFH